MIINEIQWQSLDIHCHPHTGHMFQPQYAEHVPFPPRNISVSDAA